MKKLFLSALFIAGFSLTSFASNVEATETDSKTTKTESTIEADAECTTVVIIVTTVTADGDSLTDGVTISVRRISFEICD